MQPIPSSNTQSCKKTCFVYVILQYIWLFDHVLTIYKVVETKRPNAKDINKDAGRDKRGYFDSDFSNTQNSCTWNKYSKFTYLDKLQNMFFYVHVTVLHKSFFILVVRPTRCANFANLFLAWNSTCFGQCLCPSTGVHSPYTRQWYMSYRFVDSLWAGSGWKWSSILVLLLRCLQTCMTYTIAECTVNELLLMDRGTVQNM